MLRNGLIGLTLLLAVAASWAHAAKPDLIWGVNGHPFVSYPGVSYEEQLGHLADLGLSSYRVDISSIDAAPRLERLLALAKPYGISIMPVLVPGLDLDRKEPDVLYEKAKAFAVYFAARFKEDIRIWELGNEMENYAIIKPCEMQDDGVQYNCAWGPAGGVGRLDYYGPRWAKVSAVLKGLSDGVTSVDPTLLKAMGTAGWGHVGAFHRMRDDSIEWDISVWHMYGEDPEWAFKELAKFGKPIWVTEFNHPLGSKNGAVAQAEGLKSAMTRLRALRETYNVEAAHIYELLDETYWAPDAEAFMGLIYLGKTEQGGWRTEGPKPAHCIVQSLLKGKGRIVDTGGEITHTAGPAPALLGEASQRKCDLCLFETRQASRADRIAYSYCLLLGRSVDAGGLQSWLAELEKGMSLSEALAAMTQSSEFEQAHGVGRLGSPAYVERIYQLLLGREPDGQGLTDYVTALETGTLTRSAFIKAAIASDEFRAKHPALFNE